MISRSLASLETLPDEINRYELVYTLQLAEITIMERDMWNGGRGQQTLRNEAGRWQSKEINGRTLR